ncbi:hypothetical protein PMAYCL1PPCAC_23041 [Pristionchus mayeri]|uniref:Uncharacterized protein n=1 Tax=Pristionchus mayeri TaxID=1317129 RepID=A0AAN5I723_9BILA|nr:hypothetical protein PMAYCL1PPCAC_23041 [Pristionchus mayeri]
MTEPEEISIDEEKGELRVRGLESDNEHDDSENEEQSEDESEDSEDDEEEGGEEGEVAVEGEEEEGGEELPSDEQQEDEASDEEEGEGESKSEDSDHLPEYMIGLSEFNPTRLFDWAELLKYEKSAAAVVNSLGYVGNALRDAGIIHLDIKLFDEDNQEMLNEKRASTNGTGIIHLLGVDKGIEISSNESYKSAPVCITVFSQMFVKFINKFPSANKIVNKTPSLWERLTSWVSWPEFSSMGKWKFSNSYIPSLDDLFAKVVEWGKLYLVPEKKLPWRYANRPDETEKQCRSLYKFIVEGDVDALTEEAALTLLYAVVSIGSGFYKNRASPLYEATISRDLDAVIMLLSLEVDVNSFDDTGSTALFYAVQQDFYFFAKTFIVFGSDFSLRKLDDGTVEKLWIDSNLSDNMKKEVIGVLVDADSTPVIVQDDDSHLLFQPSREKGKKTHLLSLDGGGIKGLVLTTILSELDKEIPGIFNHIGWVAGTSQDQFWGWLSLMGSRSMSAEISTSN